MAKLQRLSIVLAEWCPHCHPLSLEMTKKMGQDLGVPVRVLNIDKPDEMSVADELVRKYGDDSEDYIIPQIFAEFSDGSVKHFLTGSSEGTQVTRERWDNFFRSDFYRNLKAEVSTLS